MIEFGTKVTDIIKRTRDVKSFRFQSKEGVDFEAGQFFFVTIKIGEQERTKHFSFSNSPTEKEYVEFTKRITESEYSGVLDGLKIGDWARLKMPVGAFTLENSPKKIAFLSGGIGITPIRSICKFAIDTHLPLDMVLLYGNNEEEDIIFKDDFDGMRANAKSLRVIYTLTSPLVDKAVWKGRTGYMDAEMIKKEIPDHEERTFYICGPPKMVEMLTTILRSKLGILQDRIKIENFVGY